MKKEQGENVGSQQAKSQEARRLEARRRAARLCIAICIQNGWLPSQEAARRLLNLREAWLRGEFREEDRTELDPNRLGFVLWLYENGKISG